MKSFVICSGLKILSFLLISCGVKATVKSVHSCEIVAFPLKHYGVSDRGSSILKSVEQCRCAGGWCVPKMCCILQGFTFVLRDVMWYIRFAGEVSRPTPIRTGVKAGQYKRTFTGSLHFYELDATTTPLRPSTECRKPSTSSVSLSFPLSCSQWLVQSLLPILSLLLQCIFHLPLNVVYPSYRSTWHLRVTSGLWRHVATRRPLRLRHFIDCDHKSFYTRTSCVPLLEIAVSIGRGGFYVSRRFIVFTTRRHIDLLLIRRYEYNVNSAALFRKIYVLFDGHDNASWILMHKNAFWIIPTESYFRQIKECYKSLCCPIKTFFFI